MSTAFAIIEPVYKDPLACLMAELNETVPVPAEPCVTLILTVWPGWIFEALICVFAPLASVKVKKLLVAKSNEAVVEAIEEDITFPLNEPVTITVWFNSAIKQSSGSLYTGSMIANAVDVVSLIAFDQTNAYISYINNFV